MDAANSIQSDLVADSPMPVTSLIVSRCRRLGWSNDPLSNFLANPFAFSMAGQRRNHRASKLFQKLLSPLFRSEVVPNHRAVDRSEPISAGLENTIVAISQQFPIRRDLVRQLMLNALLPIYLASAQNRLGMALHESMTYFREAIALAWIDRLTEGDLSAWMHSCSSPTMPERLDYRFAAIRSTFGIDLVELAATLWNDVDGSANRDDSRTSLRSASLSDTLRQSHWSLSSQWLSGSSSITIPENLNLDRISWHQLREHFEELCHALEGSVEARQSELEAQPTLGDPIVRSAEIIETIELCVANELADRFVESSKSISQASKVENSSTSRRSEASQSYSPASEHRIVEIRSCSDPNLSRALDVQLEQCRASQGSLALVVTREIHDRSSLRPSKGNLDLWQQLFVNEIRENTGSGEVRGFLSPEGELAMLVADMDRPEVTAVVRDAIQKASDAQRSMNSLAAETTLPLIAGIAFVSCPARSFRIQQLIDSAWKCLEGACKQGSGSVKSIECF